MVLYEKNSEKKHLKKSMVAYVRPVMAIKQIINNCQKLIKQGILKGEISLYH
jgi:hypothetical protein